MCCVASDAPRENEKHEPRSCLPSSVRVMGSQGACVSTPLPELCLQNSPQSIGAWLEHLSPLSFCGEGLSQRCHPVRCARAFPALGPCAQRGPGCVLTGFSVTLQRGLTCRPLRLRWRASRKGC